MKKIIKAMNLLNKQRILLLILTMATSFAVNGQTKSEQLKGVTDSLFNQGRIKFNNGKFEEALNDFRAVVKLDASHVNALLQCGFCNAILKNYNEAVTDFSGVIALQPEHEWAYVSRGSAYNKLEQYEKAMDDFNVALKLKPDDAEAYNNRGFSKKMLGDKTGACEDWNKSKKLGNEEAKIILKNNYCK